MKNQDSDDWPAGNEWTTATDIESPSFVPTPKSKRGGMVWNFRMVLSKMIFVPAVIMWFLLWVWSCGIVLKFWGWIGLIIGILIGGIGVYPLAIIAAGFAHSVAFWQLIGIGAVLLVLHIISIALDPSKR